MSEALSEAFVAVADYALSLGVENIKDLPGCWESHVGDWLIRVNGHSHEVDNVPPFCMYVEFKGWPAGILTPYGGSFAARSVVNEDAFIEAVRSATREQRGA